MKNKSQAIALAALAVAIAAGAFFLFSPGPKDGRYDAFAQCLAEKGVTMYGADWCPHCQNEKKAFGDSFRFVPYVECPDDPQKCLAVGVNGYPTWVFPDGRKLEGEQGIKGLSEASGCLLPQQK